MIMRNLLALVTSGVWGVGSELSTQNATIYAPLPVIDHVFKPLPVQANPFLTLIFLGTVIAVPLIGFASGAKFLGVNAIGASSSSSVVFFSGIAAFVTLMVLFFAALNLVQTVALALILSVPMCVAGNRFLCQLRASGDLQF